MKKELHYGVRRFDFLVALLIPNLFLLIVGLFRAAAVLEPAVVSTPIPSISIRVYP